jgi:phenylalanyl-tRNA synthetase beta chain
MRAANPVSSEHAELRRSMIPGLLHVLGDNERQRRDDVRTFEVGAIHRWAEAASGGSSPEERSTLAILLAGGAAPPSWQEPARPVDLGDLKGVLEAVVERLAPGCRVRFGVAEARPGIDHPGRVSSLIAIAPPAEDGGANAAREAVLGTVGEVHPRLLESFDIRAQHVLMAEVDLAALLGLVPDRRRVELLERLPVVERDIALVVSESAPAGDIAELIRAEAGDAIVSVSLFDRYQGPPLAANEVNLAYRLQFQARDAALTDAELDGTIERLRGVLQERCGARLRD